MCLPAMMAALGAGGATAAGATAAGATAAATTASTLQTVGAAVAIGGSIFSGLQGMAAANAQADLIEEQAAIEAQLNATEDQRSRLKFQAQMRQQFAELAARGVGLDSPTAVMLGQTAAQEMSFGSQAVRAEGAARQAELSNQQQMLRAHATSPRTLGAA